MSTITKLEWIDILVRDCVGLPYTSIPVFPASYEPHVSLDLVLNGTAVVDVVLPRDVWSPVSSLSLTIFQNVNQYQTTTTTFKINNSNHGQLLPYQCCLRRRRRDTFVCGNWRPRQQNLRKSKYYYGKRNVFLADLAVCTPRLNA